MSNQSLRSPPRSLDLVARTKSWVAAVSGQGQDSFVLVSPTLAPAAACCSAPAAELPSKCVVSLSLSALCTPISLWQRSPVFCVQLALLKIISKEVMSVEM